MRIGQKLILGFSAVASLIWIVGHLAVSSNQRALQGSIGESSISLAVKVLDEIDRHIYYKIERIQSFQDPSLLQTVSKSNQEFEKLDDIQNYINEKDREWISAPKEEITLFMRDLTENELSKALRKRTKFYEEKYGFMVFGEIFVTNKYGANVAQTTRTTDYRQDDEEWWRKAREDGLYVADVKYDRSAKVYSIDIGIRIDDDEGKFSGIIKAVLNIEGLVGIIRKMEAIEKHITPEFKLVTNDRKLIYSTEDFKLFEKISDELFSRFGEKGEHYGYFIAEGDKPGEGEELFAHAHSKGYRDYKGLGWILIVEHKTKEIFAPVTKLKNILLIVSFIMTAFAVLIGLFVSRSISIPITKLKKATVEIGKGKLDTKIEIDLNDELGELAVSFQKMTDDLEKTTTSIDNLNREVTHRKEAKKELEISNRDLAQTVEKVEEANRKLTDFVYIASHDLREPLRKISSFGQLLEQSLKESLSDDDKENLKFMVDGADRMTEMIEGLLACSRVDTQGAAFKTVDLNEIVEQLRQLELANLLEESDGTIEVAESLPAVQADPVQIRQLLQNLIVNGIKYRHETVQPRIVIKAEQADEDTIRIKVQDNGIGVEQKYHENIFTMFRRLHSKQKYEGTGIGLAVCKKIVERHNGRIGVESEVDKGSTFWFTLSSAKEAVVVS